MAFTQFDNIKISGLACAVPKNVDIISNYKSINENIERFINVTGIKERRTVSEKQTCSDLCYVAAENIIEKKGYDKGSIDALLFITQHPDYETPATAHVLQYRLGLKQDCMCLDINLGCSGFVYGVSVAASVVKSGLAKRILLCCGDALIPYLLDKDNPYDDLLFGDAGSAIIIEQGDNSIKTLLKSDGSGYTALLKPGLNARVPVDLKNVKIDKIKSIMDGDVVFEFTITKVPKLFKEFFKLSGKTIDDYDYCVLHQANLFIMNHIGKKIKLKEGQMPISLDIYGNTSSASIPLTIADLITRGSINEQISIIASGFGIGLSWGVIDFNLNKEDILPIIETDDYFKDAYTGK